MSFSLLNHPVHGTSLNAGSSQGQVHLHRGICPFLWFISGSEVVDNGKYDTANRFETKSSIYRWANEPQFSDLSSLKSFVNVSLAIECMI